MAEQNRPLTDQKPADKLAEEQHRDAAGRAARGEAQGGKCRERLRAKMYAHRFWHSWGPFGKAPPTPEIVRAWAKAGDEAGDIDAELVVEVGATLGLWEPPGRLVMDETADTRKLYRFHFDCGRSGYLDGVFFATPEDVAKAIGREVYFGEVLGKHSEIYGTLEASEITEVDLGDDLAAVRRHANLIASGFDPLDYVQCEECGNGDRSALDAPRLCEYCRPE